MPLSRFGELETAVMERMWSCGRPANVRAVLEDFEDRTIAYTTVGPTSASRWPAGRATPPGLYAAALVRFLSGLSPSEPGPLRAALTIVPQDTGE
ncbi:hypothetical protein ACSNOI_14725 [Actinomadura kijaniata]|uniref:hypothetical protein n=1 Tax=Actinomadura kijaniata TaxID=46161 RepID=UPI003F1AD9A3